MNTLKGYILVTAAKNEGENLPKTIQSVAEQTIKPLVWVIMDDGSADNTPEILKEAEGKYEWIQSIRLEEGTERDLGFHLSSVVKRAFEFAVDYCTKDGLDYKYMGNVDGDMILEHAFFEKLIKEFEEDVKLGVTGGGIQYIVGDRTIQSEGGAEEPSGGNMLIRRKCFEDCSGIQLTWGWDSTLKAKAKVKGWKVKRFESIKALETRFVGSVEGYWKRYRDWGVASYYFNLNPIHAMIKSVMLLRKKPHYIGIAFLMGYFSSLIRRKEKIDDEEIRQFYWNKWRKYLPSFSLKRKP
jgi:glycosyltransferase involved in cell wall biosynthesis